MVVVGAAAAAAAAATKAFVDTRLNGEVICRGMSSVSWWGNSHHQDVEPRVRRVWVSKLGVGRQAWHSRLSDVRLRLFFAPRGIALLVSSVPVALNSGVERCPDVVSQARLALIACDRADLAWQVEDKI